MSCNCGCHDDKRPAAGWRKYVPAIVGVGVLALLIAGALLKKNDAHDRSAATHSPTEAATPAP